MINEQTIRQWWWLFKGDGTLTEIRLLGKKGSRVKTYSGYFKDIETLLKQLRLFSNSGYGIYATLNAVSDACYGRVQHDCFVENPTATNDNDIVGRDFVLIDFDPKRASDTNSSDEEKIYARQCVNRVYAYLRDQGFSRPVVADSANGYHLYYKVSLANSPNVETVIKNFLAALEMMFGDDKVDIDVSVFNASRIVKVIGTRSNKGASTADRPQRESCFIQIPDTFDTTDVAFFMKVADTIPKSEKPDRSNRFRAAEDFDLDQFIQEHGIGIHSQSRFSGGVKYVLEECPFNSNHKHPDAAIFKMDSGALGFRCLHNSCQQFTWRDFRLHFDPQAYDRRDYYEHLQRQQYYAPLSPPLPPSVDLPVPEDEAKGKKWLRMSDIKYVDPAKIPFVPTGILSLDKKIMGLQMGDVSILSGLSGCGKTSLIDNIILNVVQRNYKTAVWSGELQGFRFQAWLDQMAAGKNYVKAKQGYDNLYFAPKNICEKVNEWLDGKLFLYNNEYGNKWSQLYQDIQEVVETEGVSLVILDNLMALNLTYQGEKNEKQTIFINEIKEFAKRRNVHVLLVCHPRKEQSFQLLRAESVAGTSDLVNMCDNLFIMHRVGRDFENRAKGFFGQWLLDSIKKYDVVVEICKNRSYGVKDELIGLYYETESRRLKNEVAEYIVYGWQEDAGEQSAISFDDAPAENPEFQSIEELDDLPEF